MTCALTISPHKFSGVKEYGYSTWTFFIHLSTSTDVCQGMERSPWLLALVIGEITTMKGTGTF